MESNLAQSLFDLQKQVADVVMAQSQAISALMQTLEPQQLQAVRLVLESRAKELESRGEPSEYCRIALRQFVTGEESGLGASERISQLINGDKNFD